MSIKDIFFGKNNIKLLTEILIEKLNIVDSEKSRIACNKLLVNRMKLIFEKNNDKIMKANSHKILTKLNDRSIDESLKAYKLHISNKSKSDTHVNNNKNVDLNSTNLNIKPNLTIIINF